MLRRQFLSTASLAPFALAAPAPGRFKVSLAEWSVNKAIRQNKLTNLDFPKLARDMGCDGVEFVNTLWGSPTAGYIARLKRNMAQHNITPVLIMVDDEGLMGHAEKEQRLKAARNHYKWVDIAAEIGAHSIRTNMYPSKQPSGAAEIEEFLKFCVESFTDLCDYAAKQKINVIIENHGGVSSLPEVVLSLMKKVNKPNFGTLPDFGNFPKGLDKYVAVDKLMAYAKGVSFKCFFEGPGPTEIAYDPAKMFEVVERSSYNGFIGIEYEGTKLDEMEGVKAARAWLKSYGL
jgi:sugar phosphate isomerase/epimerase